MPVTVEGKLELFKRILFEHIEEDWDIKRNELVRTMEEKLIKERKAHEKQIKAIIEERESKAQFKKKTMIAKIQKDADEEIYKTKEKLLADLHSSLRVWCEAFVESDKYKDFLKKSLEKTLMLVKGQNISISLLKKDINPYSNLFKEEADKSNKQINIEFMESKGDIIGGFIIADKDFGMIFDLSIKCLLYEGKGYAGQLLYKELDGVLA